MEALEGIWVANYMHFEYPTSVRASWRIIGEASSQHSSLLQSIIVNRKMIRSSSTDSLIWSASKSGTYKVNLGYKLLRQRQVNKYWPSKLCWGKGPLHKVGAFF